MKPLSRKFYQYFIIRRDLRLGKRLNESIPVHSVTWLELVNFNKKLGGYFLIVYN